jgi:hypothetical protein
MRQHTLCRMLTHCICERVNRPELNALRTDTLRPFGDFAPSSAHSLLLLLLLTKARNSVSLRRLKLKTASARAPVKLPEF